MKYYYEIVFKGGNRLGGHNLTKFWISQDFLVLEGYDLLYSFGEYEQRNWKFPYPLADIKEFHIENMEEEHNEH